MKIELGELGVGEQFTFAKEQPPGWDVGMSPYLGKIYTVTAKREGFVHAGGTEWFDKRWVERVITLKISDIVTNAKGGKQSKLDGRMDLLPGKALQRVAEILAVGAEKYGEWNWMKIDNPDHINHAIVHFYKFLSGDSSEDHLGNAACRALFALEMELSK